MTLKFNNWTKAYIELQKSFGLKVVEIPEILKNDLRPEFIFNDSLTPEKQVFNNPAPKQNIVFKPLPSTSGMVISSPKTRNQKKKNQKKINTVQNNNTDNSKLEKNIINICNDDYMTNTLTRTSTIKKVS